jgi:predicted negative regulator of RcsB-dependent stress response
MEPREGAGDFGRDRALYNQGRVLLKKGDKKGALEAYKQALAKVPATTLKDEIQTQVMLIEGSTGG